MLNTYDMPGCRGSQIAVDAFLPHASYTQGR